MTSQYDIEESIVKVNKLIREHDALIEMKADKKVITKSTKKIMELNEKLGKWCTDFDSKIKPLHSIPECENPDKIFVIRIPSQEKDHQKHLDDYSKFVTKEKFKIITIDKQKGYLHIIYSFYTVKA
jgi:hypothetical protein